jgi:cystathionine beta-lyase/cystathionine gamma-synthase
VVAEVAHAAGVRVAVDNTFLTPALQRPLDLGADLTVYSTTKHIEGHSTALGGAITSRDEALLERLRFIRKCTGSIQSPLGAWLTTRGVKTLPLRMRAHSENAQRVAEWLGAQPIVKRVHYPGLAGFPQAELARRQHLGFHGGVVTFELLGGAEAGRTVLEGVQLCALAEHVGTVETLLTHPATMTHADVPAEQRRATGLDDGLIRLSVGLEDPRDVIADLSQAFDRAVARLQGGVSCRAG